MTIARRNLLAVALASLWLGLVVAPVSAETSGSGAGEPVDWQMVGAIRDEGFERSQVMATLRHLTDRIGSRLTGSPQMREANEWTRDRLSEWGLANAALESWGHFGRGWSFDRVSVHMIAPHRTTLFALPQAWTPASGPDADGSAVRGTVVEARIESESDFDKYRGRLSGRILFTSEDRAPRDAERPEFQRHDEDSLQEIERFRIPSGQRPSFRERMLKRLAFRQQLNEFLVEEGVLATVAMSGRDSGILRVGGAGSREPGESVGVPSLVMAAEQYRLVQRLIEAGEEVELEIAVSARFHDDDLDGYNTVAEIAGGDLRDEVVMVGAHLDSWHPATGSNDNAAGCAVAMEAVRILKALGVRPRRTIRIALWSGEEQGLLGSRAYVERHFASRPPPEDPEDRELPRRFWPETWPIEYEPEWQKLSAYFNMDNGSGRFRGIYTQGNVAVAPIFESWLEPLRDLGADTVSNRDTGGTDHLAFDAVGLPGFQFIQDRLDYSTRTHHTHLDHFDHAREEDLKQASVVMATFLYHAATRDQLLPRKPPPRPPNGSTE